VQRLGFDRGWRFHLGDISGALWRDELDDSDWRPVDLPHDWSIELERDAASASGSDGGYFATGIGWYQKRFPVPAEWQGKKLLLEFEGVYMNAEAWLGEHFLGRHPYGYTTFHFDLTPYIHVDAENVVRVLVDNSSQVNSRWYTGSGIYRHVWLWLGDRLRIGPHGILVTTPHVSPVEATVRACTTLDNELDADQEVSVRSRVVGPDGQAVGSVETSEPIVAGGRTELCQELLVTRPRLWSPETPHLYQLETSILVGGSMVDSAVTPFGIRSIAYGADTGFLLNGEPMKLRGGCVHHDNGPLGAASHDRAEERKAELLKANGFNAVRCAHNPPAPAFLDACDRLGMLVIDEAFDCWRNGKNIGDYHVSFDEWWDRDLEAMLLRDRNHPSVVMWSIGNELVERGRPDGARIGRMLAGRIRSIDPTRPLTAGLNAGHGAWPWEQLDDLFGTLDVCGYNYRESAYRPDHARVPKRVVYGSESVAGEAFEHWTSVLELDHVIGDFVWTALGYLGEAGIGRVHFDGASAPLLASYPWHTANCGDLDICGFKRPQSFYRDVLWERGAPLFIAVHAPVPRGQSPTVSYWGWPDVRPSWTWPGNEEQALQVDVYSACETVELFLNGESLGAKPSGRAERFVAGFEVPYRPGTLQATGCTGGVKVATCELTTAGDPARIRLAPDRERIRSDPDDLSFVTVEVVDAAGLVHPAADHAVTFAAEGAGMIAAVGNADPQSTEPYVGDTRRAYRGRCLVVLRSRGERGELRLRADAAGLAAAETVIEVV
jgi:beta-galactosidase